MKLTVSIKIDLPSERFLPLMSQCAEIFNAQVDWAIANSLATPVGWIERTPTGKQATRSVP
jgi:hypothetical protein